MAVDALLSGRIVAGVSGGALVAVTGLVIARGIGPADRGTDGDTGRIVGVIVGVAGVVAGVAVGAILWAISI
ncbi:hypothetical protein, partial [Microbispora bryophytorum]|uniref:hypothetical protein n=1 Tax=Microbispora bryophytorum TaxID=1460882 RepID=UPI0033EA74BD